MAPVDKTEVYDVNQFDIIWVSTCDIHGVARGRFIFRNSVPGILKNGLGMTQAALFSGIKCDIPTNLNEYSKNGWTNGTVVPSLATLKPLSWMSYGDKKVGHLLCDLLDQSRQREVASSREVALLQIAALKTLGFDIVTSFELEFTIFHKGTWNPVGPLEDTSKLCQTLMSAFGQSGFPVVSVGRGLEAGQLLISLGGQLGIDAPDTLHRLHGALRSLCTKEGYDISFMTRPISEVSGNRSCFIMSLLTEDGRNAFADSNSDIKTSAVGQQWMAGLLHHNDAITAVVKPTLNCYSSVDSKNVLLKSWTADDRDRTCRLQVRVIGSDVSIIDRLPTSATNPYNAIGAIIAAGIAGITNKLDLSKEASSPESQSPATLSEALVSLEGDKDFQNAIGNKFILRFILLKRGFEIARLETRKAEGNYKDSLEFERTLYTQFL